MPERRTRDRVWSISLKETIKRGNPIEPAEIAEYAKCSEKTARDVLNVMSESGWLIREQEIGGKVRFLSPDDIKVDS